MIDRSETRDVPNDPLTVIGRGGVGNSHRGNHLGPRPWSRSDRGRTYDCKRSDQSNLQRSCRLGTVHICVMERRRFTREFKLEAVRLIKGRGVSYAQASQDLNVHPIQLRSWVKALADDPQHAFPGQGQMKPEQLEIAQLKREVLRLKAERDILKKAAAYFAKEST